MKKGQGEFLHVCKIIPFLGYDTQLDYIYKNHLSFGSIVLIQVGGTETCGCVISCTEQFLHYKTQKTSLFDEEKFEIKQIKQVLILDAISEKLFQIISFATKYNIGKKGLFFRLAFPFADFDYELAQKNDFDSYYTLSSNATQNSVKSKLWHKLFEMLSGGQLMLLSQICEFVSKPTFVKFVKTGLIIEEKIPISKKFQIGSKLAQLSQDQQKVAQQISQSLSTKKPCLLFGQTGSGKTEVYFKIISEILKQDEDSQVLLLLPEISLANIIKKRFCERFETEPILWHSSVSFGAKQRQYLQILKANGSGRVVIGTRSALFLPYQNLKLIIVDEEHDQSYKQDDVILYNARDMAVFCAKQYNANIILGSATPSIESFNNAIKGKYQLVELKNRFFDIQMPQIEIIDLRQKSNRMPNGTFICAQSRTKISEFVLSKKQVMIFLNRRGYAPVVVCKSCGGKIKCKFCDVHLTEHRKEGKIKCHQCGYSANTPEICPLCSAKDSIGVIGAGVERIEEEVISFLPESKIAILTSDILSSASKGAEIMNEIEKGKIDIIIGTQVISKGYHFANLRLVCVLDADFGLNMEDFRASEKTFQLLTQVAGRSGRETGIRGLVLLQTYSPENKTLQAISKYENDLFYKLEIESRKRFSLPPFIKQIAILVSSEDKQKAEDFAKEYAKSLENLELKNLVVFGPVPAIISFVRLKYRFRLLLFYHKEDDIFEILYKHLTEYKTKSGIAIKIDVDPVNFL